MQHEGDEELTEEWMEKTASEVIEKMEAREMEQKLSRTQQLFKDMLQLEDAQIDGFCAILADDKTPGHLLRLSMVEIQDFPTICEETISKLERFLLFFKRYLLFNY